MPCRLLPAVDAAARRAGKPRLADDSDRRVGRFLSCCRRTVDAHQPALTTRNVTGPRAPPRDRGTGRLRARRAIAAESNSGRVTVRLRALRLRAQQRPTVGRGSSPASAKAVCEARFRPPARVAPHGASAGRSSPSHPPPSLSMMKFDPSQLCSRVDWDRGARCWPPFFRSAARSRRVGSVQSTRPPGAFRLVCSAKPLRHGLGWCNTGSAGATRARLQHGLVQRADLQRAAGATRGSSAPWAEPSGLTWPSVAQHAGPLAACPAKNSRPPDPTGSGNYAAAQAFMHPRHCRPQIPALQQGIGQTGVCGGSGGGGEAGDSGGQDSEGWAAERGG
jgi:hypothetical protein